MGFGGFGWFQVVWGFISNVYKVTTDTSERNILTKSSMICRGFPTFQNVGSFKSATLLSMSIACQSDTSGRAYFNIHTVGLLSYW